MTSVRDANYKDAEIITRIVTSANSESGVPHYESIKDSISKGDIFLLLSEDNKEVGVVSLSRLERAQPMVRRLAVLPDHQNKGYGDKLLSSIEIVAKELGKSKISLGVREDNPDLVEWYKRRDYKIKTVRAFKKFTYRIVFMNKSI